jgi:fructose-specific component phosphotransferase system IIB-like protein
MLNVGEAQLYMNGQLTTVKANKKKAVKVEMPTNGGFVIVQ